MSDKQIELLKAQAKLREQVQKMINQSASPTSFEKVLAEFRLNNSKLVSIGRIDHEYFNKKIFESTMAEVTLYKKSYGGGNVKVIQRGGLSNGSFGEAKNPILEKLEMRLASLREEMEIAQEWLAHQARKELLDVRMRTIEKIIKTLEMEDKSWTCSDDIDELMFKAECLKGDIDIELSDLQSTSTQENPRQEAPKVDIPHFNEALQQYEQHVKTKNRDIQSLEDVQEFINQLYHAVDSVQKNVVKETTHRLQRTCRTRHKQMSKI
ncbi:GH23589 [Drosophila grimshawi]|uniref:GH23589 n=1 Tax=Drosophila grimshawi TaxID=7222 RepID=B4K1E6_DROGR|nr:GH23589 [Drosophila grimshawi]